MAASWPEISTARKEKRKELTLQGTEISERIKQGGLSENIFKLNINYLVITKTCLSELSPSVGKLADLQRLSLSNNKLTTVPSALGNLAKLKLLDLSNNVIESLPEELNNLTNLETLNLSVNKLTQIPSVSKMAALTIFDASYNELTELPEGICNNHVFLSQIIASHNKLCKLPDGLNSLVRLTTLDISENKLKDLPFTISECPKLKDFNGKGNCISERRLAKTVEQGQMKGMMTYLSTELQKQRALEAKDGNKPKSKKKKKKKFDDEVEDLVKDIISVLRFPTTDNGGLTVSVQVPVTTVRSYIVCCIVRELNFKQSLAMFKHFINLQTRLHETICDDRQNATIATHDLKSINGPLTYTAQFPELLMITPLFKFKEVSAKKLMSDLLEEAEAFRKEKKRNMISGIHKYLELLHQKVQYPCLLDNTGQVISFPPITNSDKTKISPETTDILIEVTSETNLDICKKVMNKILHDMLKMGVGYKESAESTQPPTPEEDTVVEGEDVRPKEPKQQHLVVEQVKVVDSEGTLKVLYPSRTDLNSTEFEVIRNYD